MNPSDLGDSWTFSYVLPTFAVVSINISIRWIAMKTLRSIVNMFMMSAFQFVQYFDL